MLTATVGPGARIATLDAKGRRRVGQSRNIDVPDDNEAGTSRKLWSFLDALHPLGALCSGKSCVLEHCGPGLGDWHGGSWSLIGLRANPVPASVSTFTSSQQDYSAY